MAARQRQRLPPGDLRLPGRRDLPADRRPHPGDGAAGGHRPAAQPRPMDRPSRLRAWPRRPGAPPAGVDEATARRAEIPSANGHATAPALARLMAILALDGTLDGEPVLPP